MKNVFEGVKFGDKFKLKNNLVAKYVRKYYNNHYMFIEEPNELYHWLDNGVCDTTITAGYISDKNYDVESRYKEPIDENWMIEKAAYKCPKDSKNKQEWSDGFVKGIKYSMNHQFTNKIDEKKLDDVYEEYSAFYQNGRCIVESPMQIIEKTHSKQVIVKQWRITYE